MFSSLETEKTKHKTLFFFLLFCFPHFFYFCSFSLLFFFPFLSFFLFLLFSPSSFVCLFFFPAFSLSFFVFFWPEIIEEITILLIYLLGLLAVWVHLESGPISQFRLLYLNSLLLNMEMKLHSTTIVSFLFFYFYFHSLLSFSFSPFSLPFFV